MGLGVPPRGLAEVRSRAPFSANNLGKSGWLGIRMPIVVKWS